MAIGSVVSAICMFVRCRACKRKKRTNSHTPRELCASCRIRVALDVPQDVQMATLRAVIHACAQSPIPGFLLSLCLSSVHAYAQHWCICISMSARVPRLRLRSECSGSRRALCWLSCRPVSGERKRVRARHRDEGRLLN